MFNFPFEVEHIIPISRKGGGNLENLALSCRSCNLYKSDLISGFDELSQQECAFFNPRKDAWEEHFSLDEENGEIKGLSAIGKVTIANLKINSSAQIAVRRQWAKLDLF